MMFVVVDQFSSTAGTFEVAGVIKIKYKIFGNGCDRRLTAESQGL
jgi:hypothetical protein